MRMGWVACLVAGLVWEAVAQGQAWMVDLEIQVLDRVLVPRALGASEPQWYGLYAITNGTGMDRDLALSLFVETDVAQGAPERRRRERRFDIVDPTIQKTVEARTGRDPKTPFLDAVQVQGRLRAGERKEAIAVFGPLSVEADVVTLYVVGLSPALEKARLGIEYEKMIRAGKEVCAVVRGKAGGYTIEPLARPIDAVLYKRLSSEGKVPLLRSVTEQEGEAFYALDDGRITATERRAYLERTVLRFRYRRRADERQPQLDVYQLESKDTLIAIEPLSKGAGPDNP